MHFGKALFLAFFFTTTAFADGHWHKPADWTLGATFPGIPKIAEQKMKHPKMLIKIETAHVETEKHIISACRTSFPGKIPPERIHIAYENGKKEMLNRRHGELQSEEVIELLNHEARRYIVTYDKGKRISEQRVVIIGGELFQFLYERPMKEEALPASKIFFASIGPEPATP